MTVPYPGYQTAQMTVPYQGYQTTHMTVPYPGYHTRPMTVPYPGYQIAQMTVPYSGYQTAPITVPYLGYQTPQMTVPYQGYQAGQMTVPYPLYHTHRMTVPYPGYQTDQRTVPYPGYQTRPMPVPQSGYQAAPIYVSPHEKSQPGANNQTLVSLKDFQKQFAIPYMYGDTTKLLGSKPLVSVKEFKSNFAIPYKYGHNPKLWPNTTILLYKYSSNATTKYKDITENTWIKVYNDPKANDRDYEGEHAESIMIKQLTEIQDHLTKQPDYTRGGINTIDVILSFSPCNRKPYFCSNKLCDFKDILESELTFCNNFPIDEDDDLANSFQSLSMNGQKEEEATNVQIKITFANFYQHYYEKHMDGLKKLVINDIALNILTGYKWQYFFDAVGLDRNTELPIGREDREKEDDKMFAKLMREIHELKLKTTYDA